MPGEQLDAGMKGMDLATKTAIFAQMAKMLKAIQSYSLPETITGFGGLTFDSAGHPVSAVMSSVDAGPWPSYEEYWRARLRAGLEEADANPYIKGWRTNGIRERLEAFVETGVAAKCRSLASKDHRVVVHADLSKSTSHTCFDSDS